LATFVNTRFNEMFYFVVLPLLLLQADVLLSGHIPAQELKCPGLFLKRDMFMPISAKIQIVFT
jgi:hypothetical protein